ncbi:flagellar assembly peptidoglycan hydrolase FlgJ [Catenovulum adriaticum]|uniref:Peptidoglycan hydrolase FlgJ n=1 Tax=Catenovulum adriaticum TaxID=2984846 RepID=A0ABY7AIJ1_9ALTE|nr:flagellar assembly peptidoglycan hydrolase FlgJ [Catenovulum sp. TS8]WAJ69423.1 flagellar assembly peptidoglycan hydrolase FlgJ [Catenovulum sp. TS8]
MDKLEQSQLYNDFSGLDELRQGGLKNDKQALRKAAEHFESIFMKMMLKSMRQAEEVLADKDSPFNSQTTKFYRDMHDDQMAMDLSQTGALGLADLIVQQLDPNPDNFQSAQSLRPDAGLQQALHSPKYAQQLRQTDSEFDKSLDDSMQMANLVQAEQLARYQHLQPNQPLANEPIQQASAINSNKLLSFESKQDFVDKLMPIAEKVAHKIGIEPQAMIAQAALETGWGQKMIQNSDGSNALNFFGIKADNRWQGDKAYVNTLEHRNGVAVQEKAHFRSYDNVHQALDDYTQFIQTNPRYSEAVSVANDSNAYFTELQNAGYATDPNYASKIQAILKDSVFKSSSVLKF